MGNLSIRVVYILVNHNVSLSFLLWQRRVSTGISANDRYLSEFQRLHVPQFVI